MNNIIHSYLASALIDAGYKEIKKNIFESKIKIESISWFIELNFFGYKSARLACDFGISSRNATNFANVCLKLYGGPIYTRLPWPSRYFNICCQVGRVCEWGPRDALQLEDYDPKDAVSKLVGDLENKILPHAKKVNDLQSLSQLAISDPEWARWIYCNCAMRAAEYVFLSKYLGKPKSDILTDLEPYIKDIRTGIDRDISVEAFLGNIVNHPID
jgi:hypothetical protein